MTSRSRLVGMLLVASTALAACGGGGDGEASPVTVDDASSTSSTTTTEAPTTTLSPEEQERQEVLDAFYAQWDAYFELLEDPAALDQDLLNEHFTGQAREVVLDQLSEYVRDGFRFQPLAEGQLSIEIQRSTKRADGAWVIVSCVVDASVQIDAETGEVTDDSALELHVLQRMDELDGRWVLAVSGRAPEEEPACDF